VLNLSKTICQTDIVNLNELEQCPIRLTIHSAKKISQLEKIAKNSPNLLPPLEIAVLENNKKYVIKRNSVFEALRKAGIHEFVANLHFVKNLSQAIILHAKMSQSSPVNPLAILDLRDYLLRDGMNVNDLTKVCCLDPSYEKLLSCVLSTEAKTNCCFSLTCLL
jgi:hypothetical protein